MQRSWTSRVARRWSHTAGGGALALALIGCSTPTDCPEGTQQFGDPPRKGFETVCKKQTGSRWVEHGPKRVWHMTGEKKLETTFVDGREEGVRTEWAADGKKVAEQTFKAGKLEGKATAWGPDGAKLTETTYVAGERDGTETAFYPNGNKKSETRFRHNLQVGAPLTWLPDGTRPAEVDWMPYDLSFYRIGPPDTRTEGDKEVVKPFKMSLTEVTVAQYRACVVAQACTPPDTAPGCTWNAAGKDNHPVNCVDWAQARVFAHWAKGRLPTAGEWEFIARSGGREAAHPWGTDPPDCDRAVMQGCGAAGPAPVCSKEKGHTINGECDLLGNVAEWLDLKEGASGDTREVRGGTYATEPAALSAWLTETVDAKTRSPLIGFRIAGSAGAR